MSTRHASSVKVGTVYLTHDGTISGVPCKVHVPGEARFASVYAANTVLAADATPHVQTIDRSVRGVEFDLNILFCPETLLALLIAQLNAAYAALSTVRVIVNSLTDFDVQAFPLPQDGALYTFGERSGGITKNVVMKFISSGVGV
ncbi:MAG: hypothetical protein H0W76_28055 [Pyrinomonadaceae bacterium]|nr:hypothetical protein [Pyrinomonadaceae bacterium]